MRLVRALLVKVAGDTLRSSRRTSPATTLICKPESVHQRRSHSDIVGTTFRVKTDRKNYSSNQIALIVFRGLCPNSKTKNNRVMTWTHAPYYEFLLQGPRSTFESEGGGGGVGGGLLGFGMDHGSVMGGREV